MVDQFLHNNDCLTGLLYIASQRQQHAGANLLHEFISLVKILDWTIAGHVGVAKGLEDTSPATGLVTRSSAQRRPLLPVCTLRQFL